MLLLYALAMVQLVLFAGTTYIVARAVGARMKTITLGAPAVVRIRRADPDVRVGPFPTGASVDLDSQSLSRLARIAVALAPWIVLLAIAFACLGVVPGLRTFARGFAQFVITVDVTPYVRAMVELAHTAPLAVTAGILFAKLAAANLLPLGGLAGGAVVRALFTPRNTRSPDTVDRFMIVTMLAWMLWTLARFGWAFVQVARD